MQHLVDTGALTADEAERSGFGSVIMQAMGLDPDVTAALARLDLRLGDCFVMCSDGLSSKVQAEEIRAVVLATPCPVAACAQLVALAKQRGGEDNITVIVASVLGDLPRH